MSFVSLFVNIHQWLWTKFCTYMYMYMYKVNIMCYIHVPVYVMLNIIMCQWCHWCQELIQLTFESLVVNRLREMKAVRSREKAESRVHHLEGVISEGERKMSKMEEDLVQVTKVRGRGRG